MMYYKNSQIKKEIKQIIKSSTIAFNDKDSDTESIESLQLNITETPTITPYNDLEFIDSHPRFFYISTFRKSGSSDYDLWWSSTL